MSPNMTLVGNLDFSLEQPLLLDANSSQHSERKFQHLFSMLSLGCQKERVYSLFSIWFFGFIRFIDLEKNTVDLMFISIDSGLDSSD